MNISDELKRIDAALLSPEFAQAVERGDLVEARRIARSEPGERKCTRRGFGHPRCEQCPKDEGCPYDPNHTLYRVKVGSGGMFTYDLMDVGRFARRMAVEGDERPFSVTPYVAKSVEDGQALEGNAYATLRDRMDELALTAGPERTWEELYKQLRHELNVAGQGSASVLREEPEALVRKALDNFDESHPVRQYTELILKNVVALTAALKKEKP